MTRLNQLQIQQALYCGQAHVFEQIDSTNEYLLTYSAELPSGSVCLAETQTAGRGRRGRQWYSPVSENLYFSMLWKYENADLSRLSSLSLVIAILIAESFEALGIESIQIKWPNDIYYQGKKVGGILIENRLDKNGVALVIGIGLNLGMSQVDEQIVTQAWSELSGYQLERNSFAAELCRHLQQALWVFPSKPFCDYLARWQKFDIFYQQPVKLITSQGDIDGISHGINEQGELLLETDKGIQSYAIGEISLRGQPF